MMPRLEITNLHILKQRIVECGEEEGSWERYPCLLWEFAQDRQGCGRVRYQERNCLVHRVAWEIARNIVLAPTADIGQACENNLCFRPSHLFVVKRQIDLLREMLQAIDDDPNAHWNMYPCLEWPFTRSNKGYGMIRTPDKIRSAHRLAWEISNGPIPDGFDLLHQCDNPACFRPIHLKPGTHLDNMRDRDKKGRRKYLLNMDLAEEIRRLCAAGMVQNNIATMFGISPMSVSNIKHGKVWTSIKHRG